MKYLKHVAFVAAVLLVVSPAFAGGAMVGKDAPNFVVSDTVNEAAALELKDMKGEVILIKYWGTR